MQNYEINHEIARGGDGVLDLCLHRTTNELRVVKTHTNGLSRSMVHDNLSEVYSRVPYAIEIKEVISDRAYAMEYLEDYEHLDYSVSGRECKQYRSILQISESCLRIAVFLHELGRTTVSLHGDLTPANILIRKRKGEVCEWWNEFVREIDGSAVSGVSKVIDKFRSQLQQDNELKVLDPWAFDSSFDQGRKPKGILFRSPEHLDSEQSLIQLSDNYSFGLIFWYWLTGAAPQNRAAPSSIQAQNLAVPSQFEQIMQGCLQSRPNWRLNSAELVKSLAWAVQYLSSNGEYPYNVSDDRLLPPRPQRIEKEFVNSPQLVVCGKPVGIQQLSLVAGKDTQAVSFEFDGNPKQYVIPEPIKLTASDWLIDCIKHFAFKRKNMLWNSYYDGEQVRINHFSERREGSASRILISTSYTSFFKSQMTNYFCNRFLANGMPVWQQFAGREKNLSDSQLSNPLAINFLVVTDDKKIAIARRSRNLSTSSSTDREFDLPLVPTVSGTCEPSKCCDKNGKFDIFEAVASEFEEEVLNGHRLSPSQIVPLGLARTNVFLWPFIYGVIFCGKNAKELEEGSRISNGIVEVDSFEFADDSCLGISNYIRNVLSKRRDHDRKTRRIEDAVLFCLFRYSQTIRERDGLEIDQFNAMFQ